MLSYESELTHLRPLLGDRAADVLIARERREVFSIYPELRVASWGGVMLLATAAGIVLKDNIDRIGPLVLAIAIALASAACYAWVWWRRARPALVDDYVLLLGALLLSGCVAFFETQFNLLDTAWHRHFLLLAVAHGVGAYAYRSRMLLSLSMTALAGWLGIEQQPLRLFDSNPLGFAASAILCATLFLVWRSIDRRVRPATDFSPLFEHFAANLALSAGVVLMVEDKTRVAGCLWTIAVTVAVIAWGVRRRTESFVLYAFLFGVLAVDVLVIHAIPVEGLELLVVVVSTIAAIIGLIVIHTRMKEVR